MNSDHVVHLQRMANESWIGSPERAALDAAIVALKALEYVFGSYTDWERVVEEKMTPPWPLEHHARAMGLFKDKPPAEEQAQVRPEKPAECADGCPEQQVCDHCQYPPGPDAEAQPVGEAEVMPGTNGGFTAAVFKSVDVPAGTKLYTAPPSAPVGVEWLSELSDDELRIIFYADPRLVARLKAALAQQPAACVGCEGKPSPENTPCAVCGQQPAVVDEIERLTEQQAVIVTGYTGILCCEFSAFHTDLERRAGRPVFTHEMADSGWIKPMYLHDFIALTAQQKGEA